RIRAHPAEAFAARWKRALAQIVHFHQDDTARAAGPGHLRRVVAGGQIYEQDRVPAASHQIEGTDARKRPTRSRVPIVVLLHFSAAAAEQLKPRVGKRIAHPEGTERGTNRTNHKHARTAARNGEAGE